MVKPKSVHCEFSFFVLTDYAIGVPGYIWPGVPVCTMLTTMPISSLGMVHNSSEYLHSVIEALSLSFADTLWYNADPSKVKVPVSEMLHKDYAAKRRALIKPDRFGGRVLLMAM